MTSRITGVSATRGSTAVPAMRPVSDRSERDQEPRSPAVPVQSVPSTAAALPVAETALRQVLATQAQGGVPDPTATALDLLRSVEALLRASAPEGTPPNEIGAAAARLVERQGLLARLSNSGATPPPASGDWADGVTDGAGPSAVDTRL